MHAIEKKQINWSLYGIIDHEWIRGRDLKQLTEQLIQGGCGVLQYRNKVSDSRTIYEEALAIHSVCKEHDVPLIINDRLDVALGVNAEGVHVGQNDLPEDIVRKLIGPDKLIGISVSYPEEVDEIAHADYLGVGAMFTTQTKSNAEFGGLDLMQKVRAKTDLPLIGIGGISLDRVSSVIEAGADGVALISAILGTDDPQTAVSRFIQEIQKIRNQTC